MPNPLEASVADAFEKQLPVEDLPGISIRDVRRQPEEPFDLSFELISGSNRVRVLGEVKRTFTPNVLQQIVPWIERLKFLRPDMAIAVIAPCSRSKHKPTVSRTDSTSSISPAISLLMSPGSSPFNGREGVPKVCRQWNRKAHDDSTCSPVAHRAFYACCLRTRSLGHSPIFLASSRRRLSDAEPPCLIPSLIFG